MTNTISRLSGLGLVALLALAGCGSEGGGGGDDTTDSHYDDPIPAFPDGTGQTPAAAAAYPAGPYGIGKGSIIENFQFVGLPNAQIDSAQLKLIQLADFYNPTGTEMFPADHPLFPGQAKPKALLINVASVWCGPCNYEADVTLPPLYAKYKPMGGEFLLQLADSSTPGKPATVKNLQTWTNKYDVDYPATIDPSYKLGALFESDAFPANILIDTKTMTIVDVISGAPEEGGSFWLKYEALLK